MNILQASNEAQNADIKSEWHSAAELYLGFENTHPEIAVAHVDQSAMCKRLEADSSLPSLVLSSRELKVWMALGLDYTRKLHWLMGRLAVKKAIWKIMPEHAKASEIEIFNAEDGSPYFSCSAANSNGNPKIQISIAHTDGMAIATASQTANLGIDVERADRYGPSSHRGDEFPQMSFSQEERAQIERCVGTINSTILTRVWTAKEAAGKATQLGLGQILKYCRFVNCSNDLSSITLRTNEENGTVEVCTVKEKDYFLALAVL